MRVNRRNGEGRGRKRMVRATERVRKERFELWGCLRDEKRREDKKNQRKV